MHLGAWQNPLLGVSVVTVGTSASGVTLHAHAVAV